MKRSLVVGFVGPIPPHKGGIAQHSGSLVEALEQQGIHVVRVSWTRQYPPLLYRGQIPRLTRDDVFLLVWWNPVSWWRGRRAVGKADLILFPWATPFNFWVLLSIIARRRMRSVAIVHNVMPHERVPFSRLAARVTLKGLHGYICHSDSVARQLNRLIGPVECVTIPHPPNLEVEVQPMPSRPPIRLLFIGHLRPYKGIDTLIHTLGRLRSLGFDATLTIAGEDWGVEERLRGLIQAMSLDHYIDLQPSYVPDDDVGTLLARHHVVVQPYKAGSQSGILPLAMLAGRPVVVTRVGGLHETVREGVNGEIAEPDNPSSLADAIMRASRLIDSPVASTTAEWADVAGAAAKLVNTGQVNDY